MAPKQTDKLSAIAIYIIDKCNFSCYGCSTLSNIHENTYQDIDSFEKDLQILKKITNVNYCHLTGGEPTLHKNIVEFISLVRKYFPGCGMLMVTNGIGLEKKDSIFWETCRDNNVFISITPYPIKIKIDQLKEIFAKYHIGNNMVGDNMTDYILVENGVKYSYNLNLDIIGSQDIKTSHKNCLFQCDSFVLKNGKLYKCSTPMIADKLKKYFNINIEISDKDFIDIRKINDFNVKKYIKRINNFKDIPIPCCRYCKTPQRRVGHWRPSKRVVEEYIAE